MGAKKQTIGYHYLFSILFGLGRGPFNEVRQIKIGGKMAWDGHCCGPEGNFINKPELFGGEKKEGGIQGPFRVFFGERDQVLPGPVNISGGGFKGPMRGTRTLPDVKASIGGLVPEFRGVTTVWFDGLISSMNPYPKTWEFRARRYSAGWHNDECWYPAKSAIFLADGKIHAMNPAHIIYECLSNPEWGRGLDRATGINENSFVYSANTFCTESFGLCLKWQRSDDIDTFIKTVLDHVGAVLYTDRKTGRETLRPIRADYVAADLPHFTPDTGLLEILEDDSSSQDAAFNEVIGTGRDPITNLDIQVRAQNLAARYSQGAPNTDDKAYPGIPTKDLLARVVQRDLKVHASGLKKFNLSLDRRGYDIEPGTPFKISDPRRGIAEMIVRAGEVTDSPKGGVKVKCVQDVYGMPSTSFVTPVETTWAPPVEEALPAAAAKLIEAGYYDILIRRGQSEVNALDGTDSFIGTLALQPNSTSYEYDIASKLDVEPDFIGGITGPFTGSATLASAVTPLQTVFAIENVGGFADDLEGQALLIGDEMVELVDYDAVASTLTVRRGVTDTLPQAHAAGARLWTIDDDLVSDEREYATGETVEAKVLTRTSSDMLDEAEAATLSVGLIGRQGRPYPPGNFRIDGDSIFALTPTDHPEPVLTWAHRDRVLQADQLVAHGDASVGPEVGVTYNVRVLATDDTLLREEAGIAGDTWTYDAAMQAVDGAPNNVYIELESERDTLKSWQKYRVRVPLKGGYGLGYGLNYGGA